MRTPTPSQYRAIVNADRHVLVVAGAGSGKTSTVVGRILHLLGVPTPVPDSEGVPASARAPIRLADLAAITFTNAAAADLKDRLRSELRRAGRRQEVYEVDGARIGTIHSFCVDVLREFALRSGQNPAFEALEEGDSAAVLADAASSTLIAAIEEGIPALESLVAVHSFDGVSAWLIALASDGDRLARLARERGALGGAEQVVLELALRASRRAQSVLEAQGDLDFDRMITRTRDLLRDNPEIRRALQRRIHTLIVDEFQDVDPAQKEIAMLLGDPTSGRSDTTRLLLVGDPKQSIYRFRRADVTLWSEVERTFEAGAAGDVIRLKENFRSVPEILGFVDRVIGPILDQPLDGAQLQPFEAPYQHLDPMAQVTRVLTGPAIELIVVPPGDGGKAMKAEEIRTAEAAKVAERAMAFHQQGVPWREMAVLLPSWSDLDFYQDALRAVGAPTYALRAEGFYQRREIQDLVLALEVLRDPREDRALFGFLRSPFVGVTDQCLLALVQQTGSPCFDGLHTARMPEQDRLGFGRALISDHLPLRDRVPIHDLLESLLERSGYLAHLVMRGAEGQQPLANVRKFLSFARRHAALNVGDFLRLVRDSIAAKERVGEARLHGESDEVVTITSIHSAKGLEWRVVFWCDLIRGPAGQNDATILIGRDRFVLKQPDLEEQGPAWQQLKAAEQLEELAERKRLWYAAATRAQERLVIGGLPLPGAKGTCAAKAMCDYLPPLAAKDGTELAVGTSQLPATARICVASSTDAVPFRIAVEESDELLRSRIPEELKPLTVLGGRPRHSATEFLAYARCPRKHWFRYVAGLREPPIDREAGAFVDAMTRGQIVHDVLENLGEELELDEALEAAIGRWDEDAPLGGTSSGAEYRERLRLEIGAVAGNPEYRAVADRPGARRELGFLHIAGPGAFTEGKMDLAAPDDGRLVVLDVKTSPAGPEVVAAKAAEYAPQRDVYVAAAEAISGLEVSRFAFQFGRAGRQVSEPVTDRVREGVQQRLSRSLKVLGNDTSALTTHPRDCDFCGYQTVGWCAGVTG